MLRESVNTFSLKLLCKHFCKEPAKVEYGHGYLHLIVSQLVRHFCDRAEKPTALLPKRIEAATMQIDYNGPTI